MRKKFFECLNYSSCNEDPSTELEALQIGPGDCVACVTGSGDRPLHMLLGDPAHVYAFDINPVQNHLLELKIAAIKQLNYYDYITFLGVREDNEKQKRTKIYRKLRNELSADASCWFDANLQVIKKGVIYAGRWERYFRLSSRCIRMWRRRKVENLFTISDIDTQRAFVESEWDTPLWRVLLRLSFNTLVFKWLLGDPGFFSQVKADFSPSSYIYLKLNNYLHDYLANDSFMLALVFLGRFVSPRHYPPYLHQQNYSLLQKKVDCITIHNQSLSRMFNSCLVKYCNKYSLSDVSSFMDEESYKKVFEFLSKHPGCRFCIREFLTNRGVPPRSPSNITFYPELQEEMARKDRSIGYTFVIGETSSQQ